MTDLVRGVRAIETMLAAKVDKSDTSRFQEMKTIFEKSLVAAVDIPSGTALTREMLGIKKPGTGISAARLPEVLGKRTARAIGMEAILTSGDVDWES